MLHPTQNRPPRAQAIKNRREARASSQRFFCLGAVNKGFVDQGGTPSMVKWSKVKAHGDVAAHWESAAKPTQEVSHG